MPGDQERRAIPSIRLANRPAARVRGVQEVRLLDLSVTVPTGSLAERKGKRARRR